MALYACILMGRIEEQRNQLDYRSRFDALTGLLNRHGLLTAAETLFDTANEDHPAPTWRCGRFLSLESEQWLADAESLGSATHRRVAMTW